MIRRCLMLPSQALFTGTQAAYAVVCATKLWLFSHNVSMEHTSDLVAQGKAVHEQRYTRERKDIIIDSKFGIDFIKRGERIVLHEVKKSEKLEKAHVMQLLCYLRALREKGIEAEGRIDYPLTRGTRTVALTAEAEKSLFLPDLERYLVDELGYEHTATMWMPAWTP